MGMCKKMKVFWQIVHLKLVLNKFFSKKLWLKHFALEEDKEEVADDPEGDEEQEKHANDGEDR